MSFSEDSEKEGEREGERDFYLSLYVSDCGETDLLSFVALAQTTTASPLLSH